MVDWKVAQPGAWWSFDTHRPEDGIHRAEVTKFTDKSVVVEVVSLGRHAHTKPRHGRINYYPLWGEARAECLLAIDRKLGDLERHTQKLKQARRRINELSSSQEPPLQPWEKVARDIE